MNHFEALDILRDQRGKSVAEIEKAYALIYEGISHYVPHRIKNLKLKNEIKEKFGGIENLGYAMGLNATSIYNHLNGVDTMSKASFNRMIDLLEKHRVDRMMFPIILDRETQHQFMNKFVEDIEVKRFISTKEKRMELAILIWELRNGKNHFDSIKDDKE